MTSENNNVALEEGTVAKVGLEPTTQEQPKRRGRPKGSKTRSSLPNTECQDGASRTNGQRPKGGLDPVALEGAELAVAARVTRALGMVEGAVAALGQIDHNDAAELHPDQLVWMARGMTALREAESWLAPAVSISLGKPQVNGGTPVRVLCGGSSKEGVVQRTADNWVQVELPVQRWRGWFDLRTGLLLGQLSPFGGGVAFSDLMRLDLNFGALSTEG